MPSSPFGAGVLVTLDIVSRLIRLITVAGAARAGPRGMQPTFIRQKSLVFQTASVTFVHEDNDWRSAVGHPGPWAADAALPLSFFAAYIGGFVHDASIGL